MLVVHFGEVTLASNPFAYDTPRQTLDKKGGQMERGPGLGATTRFEQRDSAAHEPNAKLAACTRK